MQSDRKYPLEVLKRPGREDRIVLSLQTCSILMERAGIETFEEQATMEADLEDGLKFPHDVVVSLIRSDQPVKVFRKYRKMSQANLAAAVGTSSAYISQLETRHRNAGRKMLEKIADTLEVDYLDLLDLNHEK